MEVLCLERIVRSGYVDYLSARFFYVLVTFSRYLQVNCNPFKHLIFLPMKISYFGYNFFNAYKMFLIHGYSDDIGHKTLRRAFVNRHQVGDNCGSLLRPSTRRFYSFSISSIISSKVLERNDNFWFSWSSTYKSRKFSTLIFYTSNRLKTVDVDYKKY